MASDWMRFQVAGSAPGRDTPVQSIFTMWQVTREETGEEPGYAEL